jgi:hypothetical protein
VQLDSLGLDSSALDINDLLDSDKVSRIEHRFSLDVDLRVKLDCYDVAVAVSAGLIAAAVDIFVVQIPHQSSVTTFFREMSLPEGTQRWLERHFKTSFDAVSVSGGTVAGLSSRTHRLQTFGHDPLIGLLVGTIDIMRGGLTAIGKDGKLLYFGGLAAPLHNPLEALVIELGHLLSDGFTPMGLPAPRWSLLQTMQFGDFGSRHRTVADVARYMYLNGYDSRHFLTMTSSVAATEIILRAYLPLRRFLDPDYDDLYVSERTYTGRDSISRHMRFISMATLAHAIACACNAGKVAIYQGNPLAINYPQWLRFARSVVRWQQAKLQSPSLVLRRRLQSQLDYLETRWPVDVLKMDDFPGLRIADADE